MKSHADLKEFDMTNTVKCISPIDGTLYAERPVLELAEAREAVYARK